MNSIGPSIKSLLKGKFHLLVPFFILSVSAFENPVLIVIPGPVKPGQTLSVEMPTQLEKPPLLIWGSNEIPFYFSRQKRWRALSRVPLSLGQGPVELLTQAYFGPAAQIIEIPFKIEILRSDFGEETIKFPKEKAALLNNPSEDKESRLIRKFLKKARKEKNQLWEGKFMKPVKGAVLSPFGMKRNKVGQKKSDFHQGIDLKASQGEPILSPNHAVVLMSKNLKFHGNTVLLSHGQGVGSIYIHLDKREVRKGDKVKKGEVLGFVGMTGLATAPHLHWGIYVDGKAVDPEQWLEIEF